MYILVHFMLLINGHGFTNCLLNCCNAHLKMVEIEAMYQLMSY